MCKENIPTFVEKILVYGQKNVDSGGKNMIQGSGYPNLGKNL